MTKVTGKDGNKYELVKHKLGFLQVSPIPNVKQLNKYYSQKYYQNPSVATYSLKYSEDELQLQKMVCEMTNQIFKVHFPNSNKSLYDIGCGEGFFMQGLMDCGWSVYGVDYSIAGIEKHNPSMVPFVSIGDAITDVEACIKSEKRFNMINLGNVLEHVPDPIALLEKIQNLLLKEGLLRIVVPNDNSELQKLIQNQGFSSYEWVHPPDHLSYFNFDNLSLVLETTGFKVVKMLADFPIELFLTNDHSNYIKDRSKGKEAHASRVMISKLIYQRGLDKYIKYSEGLAAAGIGRTCIAFASLK
jgi:2-polyprenyl-3-methyl-5-hydroxy-6-metoxy-1,4-benzoquinol methylase